MIKKIHEDKLVVAIKEMYRNHPLPDLKNIKLVSWKDKDIIDSADLYIQNNVLGQKRRELDRYYSYILKSGKPFIVVESSVFRKNMKEPTLRSNFSRNLPITEAYHRYGWFGYFRDVANYNNKNRPSDRWEQIKREQNIEIKDWKTTGEYILYTMQRPGDSSLIRILKEYGTYKNFLEKILKEIRENSDRKIRVRMHPLRKPEQMSILNSIKSVKFEISENNHGSKEYGGTEGGLGLYEDFKNAWAVVGVNSNVLTESVCEGIPTFSLCPGSMAWDCSNKSLKNIESPEYFERNQWLYNLSYCQWREDEIVRGDPYFHLMEIYDDIKGTRLL